jgi:hypothetical protein
MITLPQALGQVQIVRVYIEHEEALLYTVRDKHGEIFLMMLAANPDQQQIWHFIPLSEARHRDLAEGKIDLLSAILQVEGGQITQIHYEGSNRDAAWTEQVRVEDIPHTQLPIAGALLPEKRLAGQPR